MDIAYSAPVQPERHMALAVTQWQAQQHDNALTDFGIAVGDQPEWGDQRWVKALYSPVVAQSIREMQAESERRKQRSKVAASR